MSAGFICFWERPACAIGGLNIEAIALLGLIQLIEMRSAHETARR